ncbi:MAG: hypothetical protein PHU40_01040 [Sulfurimonas sp.]|nr:hypothetical protein [Sulfurimonas sp.]
MKPNNKESKIKNSVDKMNNDFLKILSEISNTISMEKKYLQSGMQVKKHAELTQILKHAQCCKED